MNGKRTDRKGRNLRHGEDQMPDGRYRYRYQDDFGKRQAVYSWKLLPADRTPEGKRNGISLREKEEQLEQDRRDGIDFKSARKYTLNQMFRKYMESRPELKPTTRNNYIYLYNTYVSESLGKKRISAVRYSDVRQFYQQLLTEGVPIRKGKQSVSLRSRPLKFGSVHLIHSVLSPVFTCAVRDDYIRKNPCQPAMREVRKSFAHTGDGRHALTAEQQSALISFLRRSEKYGRWLPLITVFLGTGCRVGELIGLRWCDIDFRHDVISVNHTLIYRRGSSGEFEMHISTPKTVSGCRNIPMLKEVHKTLFDERQRQKWSGACKDVIDGYRDFVFPNLRNHVHNPSTVNRAIERIRIAYNKEETERSAEECRSPLLLPHFSAHTFRHTFCARLCENEDNVKVIQEIMGHADISTTMNIYAEVSEARKKKTMHSLNGKIRIS